MLSGSRKFHRKNKVSPQNVSLNDLASLVKRLSTQVDDLVTESNQQRKELELYEQQKRQEQEKKSFVFHSQPIIVDPWASNVPQSYSALLKQLEETKPCPNACCSSVGLSTAEGVPWPTPIEPFKSTSSDPNDLLDQQYAHWCTLMRCLPLMDSVTSVNVKIVGHYAMREILKMKAQKEQQHSKITLRNSMSWGISDTLSFPSSPPPLPPKEASTPTPCISPQKNRFQKWMTKKANKQ